MGLARILIRGHGLRRSGLALALARWRSCRWLCILIPSLLLAAAPGQKENAPAKHSHLENRFLFIVETSTDMKSRADEVTRAVTGLLDAGLKGELRKGDTIGLWTYSSALHPDFPMQVWSDARKDDITELARRYLRQVRYGKQGRLDKVWPALRQAVAKSERLTVIFIYDGDETLRGTPFDKDINALQKKYRREFRADNLPVVTILCARDGQFFDYTINYPGSISIPHTADPLPPLETNAPPVIVAAPLAPAPINPPAPPRPLRVIEIVRTNPATNAAATTTSAAPPSAGSPEAKPLRTIEIVNNNPPPGPVAPLPTAVEPQPATAVSPPSTSPASPPVMATVSSAVAKKDAPATAPVDSAAQPQPPAATPAPAPMPVTIASAGQQAALFVIAISLLTIAVALVVFLLRRSRATQPSLISQTIDRPR